MKKYELTEESLKVADVTLYRIRALQSFSDVKKGDLGGWIEKEENLSQEGNCWVYDEAKVYDDAKIIDSAMAFDYVCVRGKAVLCCCGEAYGGVLIYAY